MPRGGKEKEGRGEREGVRNTFDARQLTGEEDPKTRWVWTPRTEECTEHT